MDYPVNLSPETLALAQGILFGDTSQLSTETLQSFRTAGMGHLLAVSGLHVGIIMSILWMLLKPLEWLVILMTECPKLDCRIGSPIPTYIIGTTVRILIILLTGVYVYLIGAPPSAIRAWLMISMCLLGWIFHRPSSAPRCLLFAALILLAWDPWILTKVGFQLSFLSVAGILLFQPWLNDHERPWYFRVILLSIAAQSLTLPVVAFYFHQGPFLGWLQGLLAVPLMPVFVALLLLLLVFPSFPLLASLIEGLRAWIEVVAEAIGDIEQFVLGGHLYFYPSWYEALLAELFLLAVILLIRFKLGKK